MIAETLYGYLYVLKQFLIEIEETKGYEVSKLIANIDKIIDNTDFSILYDNKNGLFSIGFNVEENKLTDSYYDLLASEARQTSIVAIAKKDVTPKHWENLSRSLTVVNNYIGLLSWSGTSFEYLMPTINIKRYSKSLIDESCKFAIMSQKAYAEKLGITWGISEAAFNSKDLNGNYQYKAFGIPWIGLKRGLADEMVVSAYGSILAICDEPQEVYKNIKILEKQGMSGKYGLYESIDYTPSRNAKDSKYSIVKTYMAHHQGLILISINNLINNLIMQKRFHNNPEIEAIDILLQERIPENVIVSKEQKEKVEKIKYGNYDYYSEQVFDKKSPNINQYNLISNGEYSILLDKNGMGRSEYKGRLINRIDTNNTADQGILFFIKNIKNNKLWSSEQLKCLEKNESYVTVFNTDSYKFSRKDEDIKTTKTVFISPNDNVEIRKLDFSNLGNEDIILEVSSVFEPVLSSQIEDISHKAFNNLFIEYELLDRFLIVKRKSRKDTNMDFYMGITLFSEDMLNSKFDFEIDKSKLYGRQNWEIPYKIKDSIPFSNCICKTTSPVIALRNTVAIKKGKNSQVNLIISVGDSKKEVVDSLKRYCYFENIERAIKLSKAQVEAKVQYLGIDGKKVSLYQKLMSLALLSKSKKYKKDIFYNVEELWKFGISGDNIIISVAVKDLTDIQVLDNFIKAFEYYNINCLNIDLIIINEEKESYEKFVKEAIEKAILDNHIEFYNKGKIFILDSLNEKDIDLLKVRSNLFFYAANGNLDIQIEELEYNYLKHKNKIFFKEQLNKFFEPFDEFKSHYYEIDEASLKFFNGYGGFSDDGKEYVIKVNKNHKLPCVWSHVLSNNNFGTVVTEGQGGYSWFKNAKLNKITAFNNDYVFDIPSEIIYFYDYDNEKTWSSCNGILEDDNDYYIKYGFGSAKYIHSTNNITR